MTAYKPDVAIYRFKESPDDMRSRWCYTRLASHVPKGHHGEALIRLSYYEALQAECEKLRKDAERSRAAFRAVIEYMLGDGRREDPLEFLGYWTEGDFESVKEGWPEAPAAIYYADPLADHDAIDAALQETNP